MKLGVATTFAVLFILLMSIQLIFDMLAQTSGTPDWILNLHVVDLSYFGLASLYSFITSITIGWGGFNFF